MIGKDCNTCWYQLLMIDEFGDDIAYCGQNSGKRNDCPFYDNFLVSDDMDDTVKMAIQYKRKG